jgi:hypothetical protein
MKKSGFQPIVLPVLFAMLLNLVVSCANTDDVDSAEDIDAVADVEDAPEASPSTDSAASPEQMAAAPEATPSADATPAPDAATAAAPPPSDDLDMAAAAAPTPASESTPATMASSSGLDIPTEIPTSAAPASLDPMGSSASALGAPATTDSLAGTLPSEPAAVSTPAPEVVPTIPSAPVKRKGTTLNRYYFVRKGDTEASVSELIYGSTENSKQLKKWNKGKFRTGKMIYYSSPTDPGDTAMKSLYEERQLQPKEITVGAKDTLKKIASKELGSRASWTEVAVTNGIQSVDGVSEGMRVNVYPDLKGAPAMAEAQDPRGKPMDKAAEAAAAANPYAQNLPPGVNSPMPTPGMDQQNPALAGQPGMNPADPNAAAPAPEPPKKPKKAKEGMDFGKIVAQNSGFLLLLAGLTGVGGGLIVLNRRKKAQRDDFNEDGFSPAAKKRK